MKKILNGCLILLLIAIIFYSSLWVIHETQKNSIQLKKEELISLELFSKEYQEKSKLILKVIKRDYQNEMYFGNEELNDILNKVGFQKDLVEKIISISLDNVTMDMIDMVLSIEIYNNTEPHILFPDSYRHYILFSKNKNNIPFWVKDKEIIKNETVKDNVHYIVARHFWD